MQTTKTEYKYKSSYDTNKLFPYELKTLITKKIKNKHYTNDYIKKHSTHYISNITSLYYIPHKYSKLINQYLKPLSYSELHFKYSSSNYIINGLQSLKHEIAKLRIQILKLKNFDISNPEQIYKSIKEKIKTENDIINEIDYIISEIIDTYPPLEKFPHQTHNSNHYTIIEILKHCRNNLNKFMENQILISSQIHNPNDILNIPEYKQIKNTDKIDNNYDYKKEHETLTTSSQYHSEKIINGYTKWNYQYFLTMNKLINKHNAERQLNLEIYNKKSYLPTSKIIKSKPDIQPEYLTEFEMYSQKLKHRINYYRINNMHSNILKPITAYNHNIENYRDWVKSLNYNSHSYF